MLEDFKRVGRMLFTEGLVDSHGGDFSRRQGDRIYITRRDAMLGDLREGDLVEVGLEPGENDKEASRELPTHRAIYRECPAEAIVHTHSANAIAVSLTDNKIIPQDAEGLSVFRSAAIVRAHSAIASDEVARLLPTFLQAPNVAAVVKGHGVFAVGKTVEEAYHYASALENSCRVLIAVRSSGGQRPPERKEKPREMPRGPQHSMSHHRSAIPPGIGVMDRSRYKNR
ncbi:MAG: class II aldolase/adducin family protein [Candidatus Margulisbacteria bacterium]|jgi:L-fuculose-phosphate aldolase|nr:class II aldolase/adducin family protein [Candidatus Margulisiibacteriota bacterium]